jgi:hypothetical protein
VNAFRGAQWLGNVFAGLVVSTASVKFKSFWFSSEENFNET